MTQARNAETLRACTKGIPARPPGGEEGGTNLAELLG